ncbi:MAG: hypothetical protein ACRYFW_00520 [Janthinobacterium lividum]
MNRRPVLTCFIALIFGLTLFIVEEDREKDAARLAYESSPAGKAQAARDAAAADDTFEVNFAESIVQARLRDPNSAQFLAVHVVHRDGVKGVCGYVNSRNAFGGMAGNDAFAVIDVSVIIASDAYPKDLKQLDRLCYGR